MIETTAMVMTATGGPEVLQRSRITLAWPRGGGDVLVRLKAAGLNPADTFFRALGTYLEFGEPLVLGHDGAGVVEAVGADVSGFSPGDRVCFCNGGLGGDPGTYSEFAVVPAALLARIPDSVDFRTAAAFPLVAITAWEALVERAAVAPGEQVLIHAGAGGTGQMAIQIAAMRGARVAATVSSPHKADIVTGLGAELAINYRDEDFAAAARRWTGERGLDVALDNVGAAAMTSTYAAMAAYGRVVTLMGVAPDDEQMSAYNRNLSIHAVMMLTPMWFGLGAQRERQAAIVRALMAELASGALTMHIAEAYPLAEVAAAHRQLEAGGTAGKIVLDIPG